MLLAIDIGNSNISFGLFDDNRELKFLSSIDTDSGKTADQISIDLMNIFALYHYDLSLVRHLFQRCAGSEFYDGKGADPPFGQAAYDGGTRRQDRTQYPYGGTQSAGCRHRGQRRGGS